MNPPSSELLSKTRGDCSELAFVLEAMRQGLVVCKPYGDNAKYDVITEHLQRINRVQIKSTSLPAGAKGWRCNTSFGGATRRGYYTVEHCDIIAVHAVVPDLWYLVPVEQVTSTSTLVTEADASRWDLLLYA